MEIVQSIGLVRSIRIADCMHACMHSINVGLGCDKRALRRNEVLGLNIGINTGNNALV